MSSNEQNNVLEKLSKTIFGVLDIHDLQNKVLDLCKDIFNVEACSLFLYNEQGQLLSMTGARGYCTKFLNSPPIYDKRKTFVESPTHPDEKVGITAWIAATGTPYISNSIDKHRSHPHWRGTFDTDQFGPDPKNIGHNIMGIPLRTAEDGVIGVLKVEGKRDMQGRLSNFNEADKDIFEILSGHISIAISNARLVDQIKRKNIHLQKITNALDEVIASLSEEDSLQNLFDRIIKLTAQVLNAEACVLFLKKDNDPTVLIERAGDGYVKQLINEAEYKLIPIEQLIEKPKSDEDKVGLTAWIAIKGESFLARNNKELSDHPHWRGSYDKQHYPEGSKKQCNSFMGVPLKVDEQVVGVLKVENKFLNNAYVPFDEQDKQVFETLARSISIAIGRIREQRVRREQAITDAMYTISNALAGKFEIEEVLEQIVNVGLEILNAEACVVFLVDSNNPTRLIETKGAGYVEQLVGKAEYVLYPRDKLVERPQSNGQKVGLTAWIAITGQPFLARTNEELKAHPHWRGKYDTQHYGEDEDRKCNSFLGLPLKVGDEILGVVKVENKKEDDRYVAFDEREQQVFQMLANSAAIAIRNAREFKRTQDLAAIGMSAAAMAHRMSSPLQTMLLTSGNLQRQLMAEGNDTQENENFINTIKSNIDQMSEAIRRIRSAARELKPDIRLHNDIEKVIRNGAAVDTLLQKYKDRNISINFFGFNEIRNRTIECDADLLIEALQNLITNAIEALMESGAEKKESGRIDIDVHDKNDSFIIKVSDNGRGIDELKVNLFEPFKTTKQGGLGLGLFIVRRNIEAHRGTVKYVKQEIGAKFEIVIPRKQ